MGERWACGLWKDKSWRPISFNIFFSLFQPSSLDPKIIRPSLVLLLHATLHYLFFYLSPCFLPLPPSFSTVTSSRQLPSVALWRTKPGFVYMVTEWRAGWRWREGWARGNDRHARNQARTYTSHRLCLFRGEGCRGYLGMWQESEKGKLIAHYHPRVCVLMCEWVDVCV